jgi:hypothetical protein
MLNFSALIFRLDVGDVFTSPGFLSRKCHRHGARRKNNSAKDGLHNDFYGDSESAITDHERRLVAEVCAVRPSIVRIDRSRPVHLARFRPALP